MYRVTEVREYGRTRERKYWERTRVLEDGGTRGREQLGTRVWEYGSKEEKECKSTGVQGLRARVQGILGTDDSGTMVLVYGVTG